MNILITGGAGFIGSNLVEKLIFKGYNPIILDIVREPNNIKNLNDRFMYYQSDIRNKSNLENLFKEYKIDGIIHLAAVSRVIWGQENPNLCFDINTNGTRILFESLKKSNQKPWFIFGSSREVYGESSDLPVCESCKKIPINIYGETKIMGEHIVKEYTKELGLKSVILRFSNVYGNERDILDRVLPRFILAALKGKDIYIHGGNQLIDFTYIDDTVNGIIKTIYFLDNKLNKGSNEDFHLLTGHGTTLQNAIKIISQNTDNGFDIEITEPRKYDVNRFYGNPDKAKRKLNFEAEILPKDGIPATIARFSEVFDL